MDSTYKTNKYRLPLLEIVGMTSTECTFADAFAYMESERKEKFCWALEKNPHRQKFVGAWVDKVMHLGNQTTNRYD